MSPRRPFSLGSVNIEVLEPPPDSGTALTTVAACDARQAAQDSQVLPHRHLALELVARGTQPTKKILGTSMPGSRFTFSNRCTMMNSELTTIASASAICSATRMAPVGLRRSELRMA